MKKYLQSWGMDDLLISFLIATLLFFLLAGCTDIHRDVFDRIMLEADYSGRPRPWMETIINPVPDRLSLFPCPRVPSRVQFAPPHRGCKR